jgi:hypothetical protein
MSEEDDGFYTTGFILYNGAAGETLIIYIDGLNISRRYDGALSLGKCKGRNTLSSRHVKSRGARKRYPSVIETHYYHITSREVMGSQKDVSSSNFSHNIVGNFVQDSHTTITWRDVT